MKIGSGRTEVIVLSIILVEVALRCVSAADYMVNTGEWVQEWSTVPDTAVARDALTGSLDRQAMRLRITAVFPLLVGLVFFARSVFRIDHSMFARVAGALYVASVVLRLGIGGSCYW